MKNPDQLSAALGSRPNGRVASQRSRAIAMRLGTIPARTRTSNAVLPQLGAAR